MHRIENALKAGPPMKWLFCGDSITQGALHTHGFRNYVELFEETIRAERKRKQDIVINTSIGGHTTEDLIQGFEWRIGQFTPSFVLLMIGMNDSSTTRTVPLARFRENLRVLAERTREIGAVPVMQTTCPVVPGFEPDRLSLPEYMDAVRELAGEQDLPLIDHARHWLDQPAFPVGWMSDAIHPNRWGHLAFARLLLQSIGLADPNYFVFREFLP